MAEIWNIGLTNVPTNAVPFFKKATVAVKLKFKSQRSHKTTVPNKIRINSQYLLKTRWSQNTSFSAVFSPIWTM